MKNWRTKKIKKKIVLMDDDIKSMNKGEIMEARVLKGNKRDGEESKYCYIGLGTKKKRSFNIGCLILFIIACSGLFILMCEILRWGFRVEDIRHQQRFETYKMLETKLKEQRDYKIAVFREAEVSAYNPVEAQTDGDPMTMASGNRVYDGAIACPRWLELGTRVEILGRIYICEDRMNIRYNNHFDIMMWEYQDAIDFGRRILQVKIFN